MPLYTFKCASCGLQFEEITKSEETSTKCPNCSKMASRAELFEQTAKPIIKGSSIDGTGRSYIQDGDYMVGHNAEKAREKMTERDNLKRRVMLEHQTSALQRYEVEEVEKSYTGKERVTTKTEYEPLKGAELDSFIQGHKDAQGIAKEGGLQSQDIPITKNMRKISD